MYKKIIFAILLLAGTMVYGQAGQFFDAPFGGGIGYVPAWYLPNTDPINVQLNKIGMTKLSESGFYSSGIAGYLYVGFVKNLRIGGMGYGGSVSSSQTIDNVNSEVVYSLGGGGVTLEYTLPFIKDLGISVGAVIGAGNLELDIYKNSGNFTWEETWGEFLNPDTATGSFNRKLKNSYWMFTPTINLDYPIYRFVSLRLGVGYQITFADDWTADNDQNVSGIPSDLNGNSFFIQSGIFIGFFSF
ncbi:MAG: hypothetical protein MUE93_03200 [Ignavibacteriaceae bacterium]|jgi:hypothetical protein|nr:hypothetical protein [Ignavibacteriaceae bacterium]MCU0405910.1 hypothetical protein [Ignavibacteriaceae bacterium]